MASLVRSFGQALKLFLPPVPLTLSQWADKYAFLPKETSAFPGKYQTAFAEYQRGMQDAITDPSVETVVFMLPAQSGKTQIQLNAVGYFSHWEPSPMLFAQTTLAEAEKFSKNRIAKMIRDTPVLRNLYPSPRSRDSGNTLLNKEFPGGMLILVGSNAPAGFASNPIRIFLGDEIDRWEESAGAEGDAISLGKKRTTTFWNRKHVFSSTPLIKHLSRIEKAFTVSDQRRYFVPCPHCGEMQVLEWKRLHFKLESAGEHERPHITELFYVCQRGCVIDEREKYDMIRRGQWRATCQSLDGKTAGFHLNALYSPVVEWEKLVYEWEDAKHNLQALQVFINTNLAETWELRGIGAEMSELAGHARFNRDLLPGWALFLTAGVDTQDDRVECTVWAWGADDVRGPVEHRIFRGDPSLPDTDPKSPWYLLREYLLQPWEHAGGGEGARIVMLPVCALIDSGGHHTERVYEFTRKHEARRWHACKGGSQGWGTPLVNSGARVGPEKTLLYTVGTDTAKEDIFTSFRVKEPGTGYCYFALDLPPEFFRQITAEKLVTTTKDFQKTMVWKKTSERNEALDCAVYARAAVAVLRPNYRLIAKNLFKQIEALRARLDPQPMPVVLGAPEEKKPEAKPSALAEHLHKVLDEVTKTAAAAKAPDDSRPRPSALQRPRRKGGFVGNWRG
jgi:phage terminase large subunit GpA-like protein